MPPEDAVPDQDSDRQEEGSARQDSEAIENLSRLVSSAAFELLGDVAQA